MIKQEEYLKAKEIIQQYESENPKIIIGVISLNIPDFQDYISGLNLRHKDRVFNMKKVSNLNTLYYCVSKPLDLVGMRFDKVVETENCKTNFFYNEIKIKDFILH